MIGIITIGLLLAPLKFTEDSVKGSYSGFFFIKTNLRVYSYVMNFILRNSDIKISRSDVLAQLLSKKEKYFFKSVDLKKKSRFFKDEF